MVETILILGNGFDLAMKRKTSYGDFLKFARAASSLKNYVLKDTDDYSFENVSDLYGKTITKINQAIEDLKGELTNDEYEKYMCLTDSQKFYVVSDYLYANQNNNEPIDILDFLEIKSETPFGIVARKNTSDFLKVLNGSILDFDLSIIYKLLEVRDRDLNWLFKITENLYIEFIQRHLVTTLVQGEYHGIHRTEENDEIWQRPKSYTVDDKWSNIEKIIADLAEGLALLKSNASFIEELVESDYSSKVKSSFQSNPNYSAVDFLIDYVISTRSSYTGLTLWDVINQVTENLITELENLTDYLEFYLTYLDTLDFGTRKISKSETALDAVQNLETSKVISFNYTDTVNRLFGIPHENTHFIHGKVNWNREELEMNNMVFGIEDKEDDLDTINSDLIPYQKFYQRTVKETGNDFEAFFINHLNLEVEYIAYHSTNIIVFGHSVDPLDKELFKRFFELCKQNTLNYRFVFVYYDLDAKRSIVRNLAVILGKSKLVKLTGEGKIKFVKSDDTEGMRRELLE